MAAGRTHILLKRLVTHDFMCSPLNNEWADLVTAPQNIYKNKHNSLNLTDKPQYYYKTNKCTITDYLVFKNKV